MRVGDVLAADDPLAVEVVELYGNRFLKPVTGEPSSIRRGLHVVLGT